MERRRLAHAARERRRPTTAPTPLTLTITDDQAAGTAGAPPTANGAALAPYAQNPNYLTGLLNAGVRFVATDASKTYPRDPANVAGTQWPLGATFTEGTPPASFQAVPRYPSNVYYNVSRQGQQLDEYNWIYVAPANGGGCVPIPEVTTCRTAPGDLGRVRGQREHHHVPPPDGQRPAAALHAPEQPGRLQPGAAGDRPQPGRRSCTRSSTGCWPATTRPSTAPRRRWCS